MNDPKLFYFTKETIAYSIVTSIFLCLWGTYYFLISEVISPTAELVSLSYAYLFLLVSVLFYICSNLLLIKMRPFDKKNHLGWIFPFVVFIIFSLIQKSPETMAGRIHLCSLIIGLGAFGYFLLRLLGTIIKFYTLKLLRKEK